MTDFTSRYNALNSAQKQAVDTIEGPVMVVAGPGTGKTELLGVRVANILQKTDELPNNILCLTFTESGATAMRERLVGLIGPEAYKVAIHTFHSFGMEIINQYSEYFYHGAHFRPADELSTYQVLQAIFEKLPHSSLIASKMNDEFTYLQDTQSAISNLKKSGLTPDELLAILDRNEAFIEWLHPRLDRVFGERLSKKSFPTIESFISDIRSYTEEGLPLINYESLSELTVRSLEHALASAQTDDSTKPLSNWKRDWCEKRDDGTLTLKDFRRSQKMRGVAGVYFDYLVAMQSRALYDFDDMILRVVHGIEVFNELRFNLQEQYHYIMVDEFQDTNDAQMRLVWNLTNSPVNERRPNLLVVGDDDQAIYRFQGANLSNILGFRSLYQDVELITLTDNYRSSKPILENARRIILQGEERLETTIPELDKSLIAHRTAVERSVSLTQYKTDLQEYMAVAQRLKTRDTSKSYSIIARNHRQLRALLPYLQAEQLPLSYEAQENILESPIIIQLELLARIIYFIGSSQHTAANALLPELLSHPAWGINAQDIWRLSLQANETHRTWLEIMLESDDYLARIANWLIECAKDALHQPLEYMVDVLFGSTDFQTADTEAGEAADMEDIVLTEGFVGPYKAYYFADTQLDTAPVTYLQFLYALRTLRKALREYIPDEILYLRDFVEFVDLHRSVNLSIQGHSSYGAEEAAIQLLTAHRAKGLEFDDVTIISLSDNIWGETTRSRPQLLRFPHNLPIDPTGDTTDERLRLLYVAATRARETLHLTSHESLDTGKPTPLVAYLVDDQLPIIVASDPSATIQLKAEQIDWRAPLLEVGPSDQRAMLKPLLERYKLSVTHLNHFLDVTRGGPELFLLHNLLRFPQAMSASAAYGSAIHHALQRAHQHLRATGEKRPVEDILGDFESELRNCHLSELDFNHFLNRGSEALQTFLTRRYDSFNTAQIAERNFTTENISIGEAIITGAIDLIEVDKAAKTITVTDYKTGRASQSWQGKTEYEKIKLHHYRQQLIFYKLLLENSREYSGYTVTKGVIEYAEPIASGEIVRLELAYDEDEVENVRQLIQAVWKRIMALDFAASDYAADYKSMLAFEQDLLT